MGHTLFLRAATFVLRALPGAGSATDLGDESLRYSRFAYRRARVRAAFRADADRFAALRRRAAERAWRESAVFDAAR